MNARELISSAWYLSGIVSRDLQSVDGSQAFDGLNILNDILAEKSITTEAIPYYSHIDFSMVIGQQEYTIPNLVSVSTVTFTDGDVRYSLMPSTRRLYFGSPRVENISALPVQYYFERELGIGKLYFYFNPQKPYSGHITGKVALTEVTYDTDLDTLLDRFYQSYLKYKLAKELCDWYDFDFAPQKQKKLDILEQELSPLEPLDLTCQKQSTLSRDQGWGWWFVNLGRGYIPP